MKKLELTALISIAITALSACSSQKATTRTEEPISEPAQAQAQTVEKSPEGDIYATAYKLCGKECGKEVSIVMTWGRPTEIGIAHFDDLVSQTNSKLIAKYDGKPMRTYFMLKSKGSLPGQIKPIPVERFIPTENFISGGIDWETKQGYGHIEILQIKKIDRTPGDDAAKLASKMLVKRLNDPFILKPETIDGYMSVTKDKPDVVPQQVDPITWQEGQPAQIIPVRAW